MPAAFISGAEELCCNAGEDIVRAGLVPDDRDPRAAVCTCGGRRQALYVTPPRQASLPASQTVPHAAQPEYLGL